MKKLLKILLICGIIVVILLGAGLITLKVMFPPQKLKAMALSYAKDTLQREISFEDVSFNIIGVTLKDFAMSEHSTFDQGTFVQADKLQVKVALKPLFQKKIVVRSVVLDGLEVNVVKEPDGGFNFETLTESSSTQTEPEQPSAQEGSMAMDFLARKIDIHNCAFFYKDLQTGMNASVKNLNVEIRDLDFNNPFSTKLTFTTSYEDNTGLAVNVPITVDSEIALAGLDMAKAYMTVKEISASYKTVQFLLSGSVKNFTSPSVDLTGSLSGIDNTTLAEFAPNLPNFSLPKITLNVNAAANLENSTAQINQIKMAVLNSGITASGTAGWAGAAPVYNIAANMALQLNELVQMTDTVTDFKPEGQITGSFKATDKLDGKDVSGNINIKDVSVLYEPFKASALNGTINITSLDDIACPSLTGLLNGEKFTASFSYKNIKEIMNLVFNLDLSKFALETLPGTAPQPAETAANEDATDEQPSAQTQQPAAEVPVQTTAPAQADGEETIFNIVANVKVGEIKVPYFTTQGFTLTANLTSASPSMKKANGQITFNLQPGAITDLDSFIKENKIVKILLLPINIVNRVAKVLNIDLFPAESSAQKGQISYDSAIGEYNFVNGVMTVSKTNLTSKLTTLEGSGTVDFPQDAIDMKVSATLLTSQTPIVIKITGPVENPSGKLDVLNTVTSLVGGLLSTDTPGKLVSGTANTAGAVASGAVKTTGKVAETAIKTGTQAVKGTVNVATDTVKGTVNTAKDALKSLGSLFKKQDTKEEEQGQEQAPAAEPAQ